MAAIVYPAQAPLAFSPSGFTGALPVANFSPAAHCQDNAIVVLSTGTQAEGLYVLGGTFVAGDTITYNINGAGAVVVPVTSLANALAAVVLSINTNTATTLVTAQIVPSPTPPGQAILLIANTSGVGGNAITMVISTTSVTGEAVATSATLLGGSALVTPGIVPAAVNVATNIVGLAQHDSNANYAGILNPPIAPGNQQLQNVFGVSQVGGLLPLSPSQTIVATLGYGIECAINLTKTTGWVSGGTQHVNLGSPVGLNIDPTTGFYVADPTLSNLVATITGKVNGPFAVPGDDVGNLGTRVRVVFNVASLAVIIGE
jgi:hypothetical protein